MKREEGLKIGLMRLSAIGDILWTFPLLRSLRASNPEAEIIIFTDSNFVELYSKVEGVRVEGIKKPRSFKDYLNLKKYFNTFEFDVFLCTQANLRVNILYSFIKSKRKIGFDGQRGRDLHSVFVDEQIPFKKEHSLEAFLGFSKYLGIDSINDYSLETNGEDDKFAKDSIEGKYIVIHPNASSPQRTWAKENYKELALAFIEKGYKVVLTGAPGDVSFVSSIFGDEAPVNVMNFCGKTSLGKLASIFKSSKLVVAPDSGPIHLANAVGAKVVGLYAALPPEYTGPYGQVQNCVNAYPDVCKKFLGKSIDDIPWRKRVREDGIMDLISVSEVQQKCFNLLR